MCNTTFTIYTAKGREFHEKMECEKAVDLLSNMQTTFGKSIEARLEHLRKTLQPHQVRGYSDGVVVTGATIERQWTESTASTSHHCHLYRKEFIKILQCSLSTVHEPGFQMCKNLYTGKGPFLDD